MEHKFGRIGNGYRCVHCDGSEHRVKNTECPGNSDPMLANIPQSDYARGLAEGRAQGLEEAATILLEQYIESDQQLADILRDRAAEIRKESEK